MARDRTDHTSSSLVEVVSREPAEPQPARPPLVFVHGLAGAAWIWEEAWLAAGQPLRLSTDDILNVLADLAAALNPDTNRRQTMHPGDPRTLVARPSSPRRRRAQPARARHSHWSREPP
jgi:hypothetical protein